MVGSPVERHRHGVTVLVLSVPSHIHYRPVVDPLRKIAAPILAHI